MTPGLIRKARVLGEAVLINRSMCLGLFGRGCHAYLHRVGRAGQEWSLRMDSLEGSLMTAFLPYLGPGSPFRDTCLILGTPLSLGGCLRLIYHQLGSQAADLAFTAHSGLLQLKAFSGKCSLQGSREEEEGKTLS